MSPSHERPRWPLLAAGSAVILLGVLMLSGQIGHRPSLTAGHLWPLFLIAIAAASIGRHEHGGNLRKGLLLLAVGLWLLVNSLGLYGLDYDDSWPLLLILLGIAMTIAPRRRGCCGSAGDYDGGFSRGVRSGVFLIVWGALAAIAESRMWGFSWSTIWPLFLVAAGLSIVWRGIGEQRDFPVGEKPEEGS